MIGFEIGLVNHAIGFEIDLVNDLLTVDVMRMIAFGYCDENDCLLLMR